MAAIPARIIELGPKYRALRLRVSANTKDPATARQHRLWLRSILALVAIALLGRIAMHLPWHATLAAAAAADL